jgi:putative ABC transport system substrate-binding protein
MRNKFGRMIGWALVVVLVVAMLAGCGSSKEEKKSASYTIGILNFVPQLEQVSNGFKEGMATRGYVEGKNLTYIEKSVDSPDKLGPAAQELVDANVDLILATGTLEAQAAQKVTTRIPIVFGGSSDPIGAGLVETIARPGKNVTGVMMRGGDQRRLQLLTQALPSVKRVYVPYNPDDIGPAHMVEDIQGIAGEIPAGVNAIFLGPDDIVLGDLGTWLSASMERGLPISVPMAILPDSHILMGYGPDLSEMGKQATNLVIQILKGSSPDMLPVETAELFLTVSLVAAEQLNITVADVVLSQARIIVYPQDANAASG